MNEGMHGEWDTVTGGSAGGSTARQSRSHSDAQVPGASQGSRMAGLPVPLSILCLCGPKRSGHLAFMSRV